MQTHPVLDALQKAADGLLYVSETEAELDAFVLDGDLTQDRLLALAGAGKGTMVDEVPLDSFFRTVPSEDKPKFDKLAQVLKEQLTDVKVYKIGDEAEKRLCVIGKTKDGRWAGLQTRVVET